MQHKKRARLIVPIIDHPILTLASASAFKSEKKKMWYTSKAIKTSPICSIRSSIIVPKGWTCPLQMITQSIWITAEIRANYGYLNRKTTERAIISLLIAEMKGSSRTSLSNLLYLYFSQNSPYKVVNYSSLILYLFFCSAIRQNRGKPVIMRRERKANDKLNFSALVSYFIELSSIKQLITIIKQLSLQESMMPLNITFF